MELKKRMNKRITHPAPLPKRKCHEPPKTCRWPSGRRPPGLIPIYNPRKLNLNLSDPYDGEPL